MEKRRNYFWIIFAFVSCCTILAVSSGFTQEVRVMLTIKSTAFAHEGEIPSQYTCQGEDIAPALEWDGVPENTVSLVLIVDDPDAPDPADPKMTWVHWVVYNISPDTVGFPEGATPEDLPAEAKNGFNDWKRSGYGGPCPPIGRHRYYHKLYALDVMLKGLDNPTKAEVEAAMAGHILAETVIMGTYIKS